MPAAGSDTSGRVAPPPRVTAPVDANVTPPGKTSDNATSCATALPAAFATLIVYAAVVPEGVFVTLAVDVVFVTVSCGEQLDALPAPGSGPAKEATDPPEPSVAL